MLDERVETVSVMLDEWVETVSIMLNEWVEMVDKCITNTIFYVYIHDAFV